MNDFGNGLTLSDLMDRLQEQGIYPSDNNDFVLANADGEPFVDLYVEDGVIYLSEWPFGE